MWEFLDAPDVQSAEANAAHPFYAGRVCDAYGLLPSQPDPVTSRAGVRPATVALTDSSDSDDALTGETSNASDVRFGPEPWPRRAAWSTALASNA